jgi:hypothetical protein
MNPKSNPPQPEKRPTTEYFLFFIKQKYRSKT